MGVAVGVPLGVSVPPGVGTAVGVGSALGVGSGVAVSLVSPPTGVEPSGEAVGVVSGSVEAPTVTGVLGVNVLASDSRCWTNASTVALKSEAGAAGDRGTSVGRSGAAALEQPTINAAAAKNATAEIRCFPVEMTVLSMPISGAQ